MESRRAEGVERPGRSASRSGSSSAIVIDAGPAQHRGDEEVGGTKSLSELAGLDERLAILGTTGLLLALPRLTSRRHRSSLA